jgi:hypothetical protein
VRAVARTWPLRGLTATKEGRLAVIIVVAGVLVVGLRLADVVAAHKADDMADDIRRSLRTELGPLPDATIAAFGTESSGSAGSSESSAGAGANPVEQATERALRHHTARLLAIGASDDTAPPLVLVVETGWGWQARCIRAELKGHGTVLTTVRRSHC